MPVYPVLSRLQRNGEMFDAGDQVDLPEVIGIPLIVNGTLGPPAFAGAPKPLSEGGVPPEATPQVAQPATLADYATAKALPVIAAATDLAQLKQWAAAESRKGVRKSLADRIADLEETSNAIPES